MEKFGRYCWAVGASITLIVTLVLPGIIWSQGLPQSPYSAPAILRGGASELDLGPSNPLAPPGLPGGSLVGSRRMDSILLTPQMLQGILPMIPNLQVGYLYSFGDSVRSGQLTFDFLLPITLGKDAVAFGEIHNQWQDFWKTVTRGVNHRIDLSIGGGYRKIFGGTTLFGVNGFYDATRLVGAWYPSGGVGLEFAALLPGNDAVDLTVNWYGNLFNTNVLANAFRQGPQNYDFRAGYSRELWNGGPDLRLNATGYKFNAGTGVYGIRGGAELTSRDGMIVLKYEAAYDRVNKTYHRVGAFVNVGIQLSNLLDGESPFVLPEPIFRSPRNMRRALTSPVRREWSGATAPSTSAGDGDCCTGILKICGVNIPSGSCVLTGQIPVGSIPNGTTLRVVWCNANSNPNRTDAVFQIRQGAPGNFQQVIGAPAAVGDGFDMSADGGAALVPDTNGDTSVQNCLFYRNMNSAESLDLRSNGCLCVSW